MIQKAIQNFATPLSDLLKSFILTQPLNEPTFKKLKMTYKTHKIPCNTLFIIIDLEVFGLSTIATYPL